MAAPFVGAKSLEMHTKGDAIEKKRSILSGQMLERMQDARRLKAAVHDPHDPHAQYGKVLRSFKFIDILQTICRGAYLIPLPKQKKARYMISFLDQEVEVCGGEFPKMPEWSILQPFYEEFPRISDDYIEDKEGIQHEHFTPEVDPFMEVHSSSIEVVRGWRSILAKYVVAGYVTETAAEIAFGMSDRASWAALMGHLKDTREIVH